jgi:hypothetical protein
MPQHMWLANFVGKHRTDTKNQVLSVGAGTAHCTLVGGSIVTLASRCRIRSSCCRHSVECSRSRCILGRQLPAFVKSDHDPIDQIEQCADHFACASDSRDQLGALVRLDAHRVGHADGSHPIELSRNRSAEQTSARFARLATVIVAHGELRMRLAARA